MENFTLNIDIDAMYKVESPDGLVLDREGKGFIQTESIYNVGLEVYEHLKDLHREDLNKNSSINEFVEGKIDLIIELYSSLLVKLSEINDFVISFPDGKELSGSALIEYVDSSSLEDIVHIGQCVIKGLADEMEVNVISWHRSGIHAVMFFWEVNRSLNQYFQYHEPSSMLEILNDCWLHREKMNNVIFAETRRKESAKKAAKNRHAETDSMKEEILKIYSERKAEYKSVADASRKLSRVVPVTDRTIDKWIRQSNKS